LANTSQFGNNAHIAPKASVTDSLLDVTILRKFPLIHSPALAIRLFAKNIDKSNFIETITCKEIKITSDKNILAHIDGEPYIFERSIVVKIHPLSLNVLI
jgi:diacylglycerol kinase family enzyme